MDAEGPRRGLWFNNTETPEGKYPIVLRRDGTPVETPYMVLLVRDPCFEAAIMFAAVTCITYTMAVEPQTRASSSTTATKVRGPWPCPPRSLEMQRPSDVPCPSE